MTLSRSTILSHSVQIFVILVLFAAALLLSGPLGREVARRADVLKGNLISRFEEENGLKIAYSSINPALLSAVVIEDVSVSFPGGLFNADEIHLHYQPLRLLFRKKSQPDMSIVSMITVLNGDLELTTGAMGSAADTSYWSLFSGKTLILKNCDIVLRTPDGERIRGKGMDLSFRDEGEQVRYEFAGEVLMDGTGTLEQFGMVRMDLSSWGSLSPSQTALNGRFDLNSFQSNLFKAESQSLDVTLTPETITVRRLGDAKPVNLQVIYLPASASLSVNFEAVDLKIRDIVSPGSSNMNLDPWFDAVLNGSGSLHVLGRQTLEYDAKVDLSLDTESFPWFVVMDVSGDEKKTDWRGLEIQTPWGSLSYKGILNWDGWEPEGRIGMELGKGFFSQPIFAEFELQSRGDAVIYAQPIDVRAGALNFEDFRFLVIREEKLVTLSLLAVPESPDEEDCSLTVDAIVDFRFDPTISVFTSLRGIRAGHLARLGGIQFNSLFEGYLDDMLIDVDGFMEAGRDSWVVTMDHVELHSKTSSENRIIMSGYARDGEWSLDSLFLSLGDFVMSGQGFAEWDQTGGAGQGRLLIDNEIYPLNTSWETGGAILVHGPHGLTGSLKTQGAGERSFRFVMEELPFPLRDGLFTASVDVEGRVTSRDWNVSANRLSFSLTDRENAPDKSLTVSGSLGPHRLVFPIISFSDGVSNLTGNVDLGFSETETNLRFFLTGPAGESYAVTGSLIDGEWNVDLNIVGAQLARFVARNLGGTADITGKFIGTLEDPHVRLTLSTSGGSWGGSPLEAAGKLELSGGKLRVRDIHFIRGGTEIKRALVFWDLDSGKLHATASLTALYNQVSLDSGFSLAVDLEGPLNPGSGLRDLYFNGTLSLRPLIWDGRTHLPALTVHFKKDSQEFSARIPDGDIFDLHYNYIDGALTLHSEDPLPLVLRGGGIIKDGSMDLSFPTLDIDPILINYIMPRDSLLKQYYVVFQDGRMKGDLIIQGPVGDPIMKGLIQARDIQVDTPYTYAEIGRTETTIRLEEKTIFVDPLEIQVGGGILAGGGSLTLERWRLADINMIFEARESDSSLGVPAYYPLPGLNLDGVFTGELSLIGDMRSTRLDGTIHFPILKVSLGDQEEEPPESSSPNASPHPFFLDIDLVTGKKCTFYLPNEQLKIFQATAEPLQVINIFFSRVPKSLSITGDLSIKTGEIRYFDRRFQLTEGLLAFDEDLELFNPNLAFRAETRIMDENNDPVTVALIYDAPILEDFRSVGTETGENIGASDVLTFGGRNSRIETSPKRSDWEILALFDQAVLPYGNAELVNPTRLFLETGSSFIQSGFVQPLEEVIQERFNLDIVTIHTDIIKNTLEEGLIRDELYTGTSSELGRFLDNTSLQVGKYIGDSLFLSGILMTDYLENEGGGLGLRAAFSLEMQTPLFDIVLSTPIPDFFQFSNPDTSWINNFVQDNSISLEWNFSY